jgi:hypothetical protein
MPQFDNFSFLSQLFWVFLTFGFFFFFLSYYLLPALSVILKVRKRKLSPANLTCEKAATTSFDYYPLIFLVTAADFFGFFVSVGGALRSCTLSHCLPAVLVNFAKSAACNESFQRSLRLFSAKTLEKALKTFYFAALSRGLKKPRL